MMSIKAVLFDLDGTLIDTNNLIIESYRHTLKKHLNIVPDKCDIVKYFGEPLITTLSRFDKENAEDLRSTYVAYNESMHDSMVRDIPGALETLVWLRENGIKTAVVTSKRRAMAERGLNLLKLYDLIDIIVTPEDTEKHKPHGEPAQKACSLLGVDASESLLVGDSHFDILCGKNAGVKTCLVKYTALSMEELIEYEPDFIIESMCDLKKILKEEQ